MDAIILAGGKGSRMESEGPKALVEVKGKAILAFQLDYLLKSKQINKIILSLGYLADEVIEYINLYFQGAPIKFAVEHEPLGTGGAIKLALAKANSDFVLVLNCDDITDIDLAKLNELKDNTICVAHPQLPFGLVKENNGYAEFLEKPILDDWVSCGWYVFNRQQLLDIIPDKSSIEYDVFPKIKLRIYKHEGFWQPINNKKDINRFEGCEFPESLK